MTSPNPVGSPVSNEGCFDFDRVSRNSVDSVPDECYPIDTVNVVMVERSGDLDSSKVQLNIGFYEVADLLKFKFASEQALGQMVEMMHADASKKLGIRCQMGQMEIVLFEVIQLLPVIGRLIRERS